MKELLEKSKQQLAFPLLDHVTILGRKEVVQWFVIVVIVLFWTFFRIRCFI